MDIYEYEDITGVSFIQFENSYEERCTLAAQGPDQLRCAIREKDNNDFHAPFTHFKRDEVAAILPYLQAFVEIGELKLPTQETSKENS